MKKVLLIIPVIIMVIALIIIATSVSPIGEFDTQQSERLVEPSNQTPSSIEDANNQFAVDFYKQISDNNDNIFYSPTSAFMAFSILYEGAKENTARQIQDVFGFEVDPESRYNMTSGLISSLNRYDPNSTLTLANALWLADNFVPHASYVDIIRDEYRSDVQTVSSIDPDDGIKKINDWASNQTNGKINKVIEVSDGLTAAIITNAIYFKSTWLHQFPEENTKESYFWRTVDESVTADFMRITFERSWEYTESDGVQVLKLPYVGNRLSMLVILPEDRDGIQALDERLSYNMIQEWNQNLTPRTVIIAMPKFEIKTHYGLIKPLSALGMTDVFNSSLSDLSGIGGDLFVSSATQDAYVNVNESGTDAAAVTVISASIVVESPPPLYFNADHPFLFIIQDDTSGTILFMGRIMDPSSG